MLFQEHSTLDLATTAAAAKMIKIKRAGLTPRPFMLLDKLLKVVNNIRTGWHLEKVPETRRGLKRFFIYFDESRFLICTKSKRLKIKCPKKARDASVKRAF